MASCWQWASELSPAPCKQTPAAAAAVSSVSLSHIANKALQCDILCARGCAVTCCAMSLALADLQPVDLPLCRYGHCFQLAMVTAFSLHVAHTHAAGPGLAGVSFRILRCNSPVGSASLEGAQCVGSVVWGYLSREVLGMHHSEFAAVG